MAEIKEAIMTQNPCYTAGRTIKPKGLMLHSVGCPQPSAEVFYRSWNSHSYGAACVHGFIDANTGVVWKTLPWNWRGWHCGGSGNDTHIGIEMCEPESISYVSGSTFSCSNVEKARRQVKTAYDAAVTLFASLCREYNLDPLGDGVIVSHREGYYRGIATNHGDPEHLWDGLQMGYTMDGFRRDVTAAMWWRDAEPKDWMAKLKADDLTGNGNTYTVKMLGELAKEDAKKTGVLASITCAQAILESGYCHSELASKACNLFGMKCNLSGNTWPGTSWDGQSVYSKITTEYENGKAVFVTADFRKYPSVAASIADHSAYLLGAKNGKKTRYDGIKGNKDFDAVAKLLLSGGYATDPAYPEKLKAIRDKWNLSGLDEGTGPAPSKEPEPVKDDEPYLVKISISDLRIRSGPGTWYDVRGYIPIGVYTIVETRGNWGRLKSGAGWICLDYAEKTS